MWQLTEERVRQSNGIDLGHCGIVDEVRINEEENRHVDCFSSVQSLFLETKALYLAEVWCHLSRRNIVGRHPDDVLGAFVRSRVKCQRGFPRQDPDLSLLWSELPWHHI